MYCFVSVGLVCGRIRRKLLSMVRNVSKNGMPSGALLIVNLIVGCQVFSHLVKMVSSSGALEDSEYITDISFP